MPAHHAPRTAGLSLLAGASWGLRRPPKICQRRSIFVTTHLAGFSGRECSFAGTSAAPRDLWKAFE